MDFNDIFKFDEIANDNDINSIGLEEKINKKIIPDNSSDKIIENSTDKNLSQYNLNNNNNMLLDMSDITINTAINSLSEIPFDNSVNSNLLLNNSDKKLQNIYNSVALKTEPNTIYPQLYPTEEYPIEEEQDTFVQYMNYPNANINNMNNIPYPLYYNNSYNQDETLQYNSTDFMNYNSEFDINGMNPYYPFPPDIDMEDIDMDAYSLISNTVNNSQELSLVNEDEIKAAINGHLISNSNEIENKIQKNINVINPITDSVVSPISYNKPLNDSSGKIPFNSNSLIVPSNDENEALIDDMFKYIYPMNNKNKLLNDNLKNNMNFEDLISIDSITQQMNLSDNFNKKSFINNKMNPINNLENMDLNQPEFTHNINTIFSEPIEKNKQKSETDTLKEDLLNSIKDMNKLLDFDFSSLDNVLEDDFVKVKTSVSTNKNDSNSKSVIDEKLFSNPKNVQVNKNESNISPEEPINEYKNLINSLNPQNKDYSDNLIKMFISSPKFSTQKNITDSNNVASINNNIKENDFSKKILVDKTMVGSPSINIPTSPTIPDLLKEIKEESKNIFRSSSMPQLSSSKEPSEDIQHKLINKSKPILKSHSILNNISSPIQKNSPILSKNKSNLLLKELEKSNILSNESVKPLSIKTSTTTTSSSNLKPITTASSIKTTNSAISTATTTSTNSTSSVLDSIANTTLPLGTSCNSIVSLPSLPILPLHSLDKSISISTPSTLLSTNPNYSTINSKPSDSQLKSITDNSKSLASTSITTSTVPSISTTKTSTSSKSLSLQTSSTSTISTPVVTSTPKTTSTPIKPLIPLISTPILPAKQTSLTTSTPSTSATTTTTKIVPKPIAPLTTLPPLGAIPPLPLTSALNSKQNLNVPPVIPPLLSNPKLFPFLFATDSSNLISNAAKTVAENLTKSTLPTSTNSSTTSTPSTTSSTTTSNSTLTASSAASSATLQTASNSISSALSALSTLPLSNPSLTAPLLPTSIPSKVTASTMTIPIKKEIKKENNVSSCSSSTVSNTSVTTPTLPINNDTKNHKNVTKNNTYVDEKRRKFLERNRIAASKCRQKKKAWVQDLEKKSTEVSITNRNLKIIVNQLKDQVAVLRSQLLLHKNCQSKVIQQYLLQQSSINLSLQNTLQSLNQNSVGNQSLLNFNKIQ